MKTQSNSTNNINDDIKDTHTTNDQQQEVEISEEELHQIEDEYEILSHISLPF